MIANNFVRAQLDAEEDSEQPFANEQERLAMTIVLHDYKTAYETNGRIDLEKLFNQLGSIFKPEVESTEDDLLQAAMMAHAKMQPRPVHQDKGNYMGPKKKHDTRQGTHESPRLEKLMQVMYDMKAEMGALRRALHQAGICVDAPYNKKNKEQPINGSQKSKFAGIAKRANRSKRIAAEAHAAPERTSPTPPAIPNTTMRARRRGHVVAEMLVAAAGLVKLAVRQTIAQPDFLHTNDTAAGHKFTITWVH
jgi:hypothetical protein